MLSLIFAFFWQGLGCAQSCPTLCNPVDCSLPHSSVEFSRQEYQRGLPVPPPGDLPAPGIEPTSPALEGGFSPLSRLGSPETKCGSPGSGAL